MPARNVNLKINPIIMETREEESKIVTGICYLHGRVMLHPEKCKECRHEGECKEYVWNV